MVRPISRPIGTSGTIQLQTRRRLRRNFGFTDRRGVISLAAVEALIDKSEWSLTTVSETAMLKGLSERRAQVWPGGLSILAEILDAPCSISTG